LLVASPSLFLPSPSLFFLPLVQTAWQYKQGLSNKKLITCVRTINIMKIATNAVLTKVMTMMESVILMMMKQLGVALLFTKKMVRTT
jgi:hypothetical protein